MTISFSMTHPDGEFFRSRLSVLAKAQGGEDSEARQYRNKLVSEGLTEGELDRVVELLDLEYVKSSAASP